MSKVVVWCFVGCAEAPQTTIVPEIHKHTSAWRPFNILQCHVLQWKCKM